MGTAGQAKLRGLQQDLNCPKCEYNLRGLRGAVVNCPECGESCDVIALILEKRRGPWWSASCAVELARPVAWSFAGAPLALLGAAWAAVVMSDAAASAVVLMLACLLLAGWAALMRSPWRSFEGWRGVKLSLLLHVVFLGYFLGIPVGLAVATVACVAFGEVWSAVLVFPLTGLPVIAMFRACRRLETWIGRQCLLQAYPDLRHRS